jgi:hypothetical protein
MKPGLLSPVLFWRPNILEAGIHHDAGKDARIVTSTDICEFGKEQAIYVVRLKCIGLGRRRSQSFTWTEQ